MNELHDLLAKIKKIEEADVQTAPAAQPAVATAAQPAAAPQQVPAPETGDQTYTRRQNADKAKAILKNSVKKANDLFMVNGYYIEDGGKTGTLLHHMMANSKGGGANDQGTVVTTKDIGFGQGKEFADQLTSIGLKITPQVIQNPGIFGWKWTQSEKTVLTVNLDDLRKIAEGKPPMMDAPPPPAPAPVVQVAPPAQNDQQVATNGADPKDIAELKDILTKLGATIPSKFSISSAPNNLGPRQSGLGGSLYEGIKFKSSIGRSLLAELDAAPTISQTNQAVVQAIAPASATAPKLNVNARCKMCSIPYKDHFNFEPEGDPNGKVTSTKFRHPASPTNQFFPGLTTEAAPADPAQSNTLPPPAAGQLSPDERTKLIARAKTLYDKLLPYKDNLEVSPLLAAYLTAQKEAPAPADPEVRPVPTVRIEPNKIPDPSDKPPVEVVPPRDKPPVEVVPPRKRENDQEKTTEYPASWMKVPIELAHQNNQGLSPFAGTGAGGVYVLGKGTPEQAFGYHDNRSNTLVILKPNTKGQEDKRYAPIPWGDKRFPWVDSRGGVTRVQAATGSNVYIVKAGDTLTLKRKDLEAANPQIKNFNKINPGDRINLPGAGNVSTNEKLPIPPENSDKRTIISYINQEVPNAKYHDYFWVNGRRWRLVADGKGTNRYIWTEDNPVNTLFGQDADRTTNKYTGPDESKEVGQPQAVTPQKEDDALRYAIQSHINMGSPDSSPTAKTVIKMADWYRKHPDELQKKMKEIGLKPMAVKEGVGFANDELNRIMSLVHHR